MIVVTDIDDDGLARAAETLPPEKAAAKGVALHSVNTALPEDPIAMLRDLTDGGGFDDAFVYAPVRVLVEQADRLFANDGCLNFFAGPTDHGFTAPINLYNVHYASTHIGGLNAAAETILRLPDLSGGKKLVYPHIEMPLTAIADFKELGVRIPLRRPSRDLLMPRWTVACRGRGNFVRAFRHRNRLGENEKEVPSQRLGKGTSLSLRWI